MHVNIRLKKLNEHQRERFKCTLNRFYCKKVDSFLSKDEKEATEEEEEIRSFFSLIKWKRNV